MTTSPFRLLPKNPKNIFVKKKWQRLTRIRSFWLLAPRLLHREVICRGPRQEMRRFVSFRDPTSQRHLPPGVPSQKKHKLKVHGISAEIRVTAVWKNKQLQNTSTQNKDVVEISVWKRIFRQISEVAKSPSKFYDSDLATELRDSFDFFCLSKGHPGLNRGCVIWTNGYMKQIMPCGSFIFPNPCHFWVSKAFYSQEFSTHLPHSRVDPHTRAPLTVERTTGVSRKKPAPLLAHGSRTRCHGDSLWPDPQRFFRAPIGFFQILEVQII